MENLSYIALSRQVTLFREINLTANNIANINTPGFKKQSMLFVEHLNKAGEAKDTISQVNDYSSYRDNTQGALRKTDNQLDLAIQGDGFFVVKTPEGQKYARAGNFTLNNQREIVTKDGYQVMGDGGPLVIQEDAYDINITKEGTISTNSGDVGKIKLVTFKNLNNIVPIGNNLFEATKDKETAVLNPSIQQGMLEQSNVQPVLEMSRMIEIQRMFEMTQNLVRSNHDLQRNAIQQLTRV